MKEKELTMIYRSSFANEALIKESKICGCFYCGRIFPAKEVTDYINDEKEPTGICPYCNIDSIIGDKALPITEELLDYLYEYYFRQGKIKYEIVSMLADDIDDEFLDKHVYGSGNYVWHLFSYEMIEKSRYLVKDEARKAYDEIDKSNTRVIKYLSNEEVSMDKEFDSAKKIDRFDEIYVLDNDCSWVYIKNHEDMGPYFMKKNIKGEEDFLWKRLLQK